MSRLGSRLSGASRIWIAAALGALALKLYLALSTFGTNDVRSFMYFARRSLATGPFSVYQMVKDYNHPPSMLPVLEGMNALAESTGVPFGFWLRLPAILADVGSLLLVALVLAPAGPSRRRTLVLMAAAPMSVMVSGFHGNTDPIMIFFTLVSIALLHRSAPAWLAGIAMGMAINVKIVPLVFWPAICLWLPDWRKRTEYFGAAVLVVALAWSSVFFDSPALVTRRVLGYAGSYGLWGVSRILDDVGLLSSLSPPFKHYGRHCLVAILVALSVWMNRGREKPPIYRQLAVIGFGFLALAPAFGVQYLAWVVPFTVGVPTLAAAVFHLAGGAFLFAVYTFWCQFEPGPEGGPTRPGDPNWLSSNFWERGLPWDNANANRIGAWHGELVWLEIAAWLAVVLLFVIHLRGAAAERKRADVATAA